MRALVLLIPVLVFGARPAVAQGCPSFFAPVETGVVQSADIDEASGMVASVRNPGVFWVHNDSGDSARVFAVAADGTAIATYDLVGAAATDWEDMARGPGPSPGEEYLYLGDIGDNAAARSFITVYRVAEPTVDLDNPGASLSLPGAVALEMEYPDGAHDAETLLADPLSGDLFVVTKCFPTAGCSDGVSQVFRYPFPHQDGVRVVLTEVATIPFVGGAFAHSATAGDITASGDTIAVRTYNQALSWSRAPGQSIAAALVAPGCSIPVPAQLQGETFAFSADGVSYSTVSEFAAQPILRIDERFGDRSLLGNRFLAADRSGGADPAKRRVRATAREKSSPDVLSGDPLAQGAVLRVVANGAASTSQTFVLAPGKDSRGRPYWRELGATGFRYADPLGERGPVRKVVIRRSTGGTFSLLAVVDGRKGPLDVGPPAPGTDALVTLRIPGGDRYCVQYGADGRVRNSGATRFRVDTVSAQACPP